MTGSFDVERSGGIAHLRLDRPEKRNSLLPEFWDELPRLVRDLDADGGTRVIVISSTGPHFSSGLDLSVFQGAALFGASVEEPGRARAAFMDGVRGLNRAFDALDAARVPVLAAVQGGCIGGAVGLAAACDLRYATADAFFVLQEINLGLTADVGQLQRLPRVLPEGVVRELAYLGRPLPAERAERLGFVNAVFADHAALLDGVLTVAAEIAAKSPLAIWGGKRAIDYARDHSVADGLDRIALWQAAMYHRTDTGESLRARQEGRAAVFADLPPVQRPDDLRSES